MDLLAKAVLPVNRNCTNFSACSVTVSSSPSNFRFVGLRSAGRLAMKGWVTYLVRTSVVSGLNECEIYTNFDYYLKK